MKYIDTHTHLNYSPLVSEVDQIIKKLEEKEMWANIVGCNKSTSLLAIKQAKLSPNLFCSIGIHPNDINEWTDTNEMITFLESLYLENKEKILCVGECGLDFYYQNDEQTKKRQEEFFIAQIKFASKYKLPIMMHIRNAFSEAYEIIKKYNNLLENWIVHCFNGNKLEAEKYLELGCFLSIPGIVTFSNANDLREAVKIIPINRMLTETDAPWLAPIPYRGKTNYPFYVIETNNFISQLLDLPRDVLNNQLIKNACIALKINVKI